MDNIEKDKQQHQDEEGNGFWNFKHIVGIVKALYGLHMSALWTTLAWTLHWLSPQWMLLTLQGRTWYLDETWWWFVWVCGHVCWRPLSRNVVPKIIHGYSSEQV
jgi:hypothetical protein